MTALDHRPKPASAAPIAESSSVSGPASAATATTVVLGLLSAWTAAGSLGMMADPLRLALFWTGIAAVLVIGGAPRTTQWHWWAAVSAALLLPRTWPSIPSADVLAVAVVLAAVSAANKERRRLIIGRLALGVAVFGLWRLVMETGSWTWLAVDALAGSLGALAGWLAERPLQVGPTLAAFDALVLSAVAGGLLLTMAPGPRKPRVAWFVAGLAAAHLLYLAVLAWSADLLRVLPEVPPPPESDLYLPPPWHWADALRAVIPWNLPILAAALHTTLIIGLLRWTAWPPSQAEQTPEKDSLEGWRRTAFDLGPAGLAIALALLVALLPGPGELRGKRIVAHAQGYLNWQKPEPDRYGRSAAGLYGMLPDLVQALGGEMALSTELSSEELAEADVLVLLHPVAGWPEPMRKRVWQYVEAGGSLLVVGEAHVREEELVSGFDEVLAPTPIRVRFDTAIGATPHWEEAAIGLTPTARRAADATTGCLGTAVGASLDVAWPARPLLVGRYGWSDPGSDAAMTRVWQYDAGERLGDLVLAAECRHGAGTVVVVADTTGFQNENLVRSYPILGDLLARLADDSAGAQAAWRQFLALLTAAGLIGVILWRRAPQATTTAALMVASLVGLFSWAGARASAVVPGTAKADEAPPVACIDAGHLNGFSPRGWAPEGINGLGLTLMRNGYLPTLADDLSPTRLQRAKLLICIAPARPYSASERARIVKFVERGGILICTVGAEEARASNRLLAEFEMRVPPSPLAADDPAREPAPMGCFRTPYLDLDGYRAEVLFYAGWPIEHPEPAHFWVRGFENQPIVCVLRRNRGYAVLVGDTAFLTNQNLENMAGMPIGGRHENADFLRWLIGHLTDRPDWTPPKPPPAEPAEDEQAIGLPHEAAAGTMPDDDQAAARAEPAEAAEEPEEAPPDDRPTEATEEANP